MRSHYFIILLSISSLVQAQIVTIPDANFKFALVSTNCVDTNADGIMDDDADTNNDGEIQVSEAEAVLVLDVSINDIVSILGIESFVNLEYFFCIGNSITSMDISQNTNLVFLAPTNNNLTSLDVTKNTNLEHIDCSVNQITSLNTSQNTNLERLIVRSNNITSLDPSQNILLTHLDLQNNRITSLDVSQNVNLFRLLAENNRLESLNIKNGNNEGLNQMLSLGNPNLFCIQVDDEVAANDRNCFTGNAGWCKDTTAVYSEECILGSEDLNTITFTLFPNPTHNYLNINSKRPIELIRVYTLTGQLVLEANTNRVDVSKLNSGLYFANVTVEGKSITKRFIKS